MATNLFFDTEFTGLHQGTTLISLGIVADDSKMFYAEFTDYDKTQIDLWLQTNIINKLILKPNSIRVAKSGDTYIRHGKDKIREYLLEWLSAYDKIEMWSDCYAYDWVLFNNLFGTAFDIPKNISYIPLDLSTLFKIKGVDPDTSREDFVKDILKVEPCKHNALWDAVVIKACYNKLMLM